MNERQKLAQAVRSGELSLEELSKEQRESLALVHINPGPIIHPEWIEALVVDPKIYGTGVWGELQRGLTLSLCVILLKSGQIKKVGKGRIKEHWS